MKHIAYVIKWGRPAREDMGAVRCNHITETPVLCYGLTGGSFYPNKQTADNFLFKFQEMYGEALKFSILKATIKFKEQP